MVVERFRNGDAGPVYRRFGERGNLTPEGVRCIAGWVDERFATCFRVMEAADRGLLDAWMCNWVDLVEFEVHPVITSLQAALHMVIAPQAPGDRANMAAHLATLIAKGEGDLDAA